MNPDDDLTERAPLSRDRVLRAAVQVADREGLAALTMRRLGTELGVEAMSLYKHVANKEEILDGVVEVVMGEIELPAGDEGWKDAMRRRAISAREVLTRHSWSIGLLETRRTRGPGVLRYADTVLGVLRSAGFSVENAGYAFVVLDSYVYGHVIQETAWTAGGVDDPENVPMTGATPDEYSHLMEAEAHARQSGFTIDRAFEFGLDLILDALQDLLDERP